MPSALDRALLAAPDQVEIYWQKMVFLKKDGHVEDALNLLGHEGVAAAGAIDTSHRAALLESSGRTEQARRIPQLSAAGQNRQRCGWRKD